MDPTIKTLHCLKSFHRRLFTFGGQLRHVPFSMTVVLLRLRNIIVMVK